MWGEMLEKVPVPQLGATHSFIRSFIQGAGERIWSALFQSSFVPCCTVPSWPPQLGCMGGSLPTK